LQDPNQTDDANHAKRHEGQLLSEFVHIELQRGPFFLNLIGQSQINLQFKGKETQTSCIIEKMTPNSVSVPVAITIPVARPIDI
jgi:hypothetical protein